MRSPGLSPKGGEGGREVAPIARMLTAQTKSELLQLLRDPAFVVSSVALPTIFFAFFGLPVAGEKTAGTGAGDYLLASFGAYGVVSVMLFSFGAGVAAERGRKTDVLMRATPLRPVVLLCAKTVSALLFAFATLVVLFAFGRVAGGVELGAATWATLTYRLLVGSTPFVFLGFAVGYLARPTSAAAVIQLIYLPIAFASGMFVPLEGLPEVVRKIAPYLPTYRYAELAWSAVGANTEPLPSSTLWLLGYAVAFAIAAIWAYRREEIRRFVRVDRGAGPRASRQGCPAKGVRGDRRAGTRLPRFTLIRHHTRPPIRPSAQKGSSRKLG